MLADVILHVSEWHHNPIWGAQVHSPMQPNLAYFQFFGLADLEQKSLHSWGTECFEWRICFLFTLFWIYLHYLQFRCAKSTLVHTLGFLWIFLGPTFSFVQKWLYNEVQNCSKCMLYLNEIYCHDVRKYVSQNLETFYCSSDPLDTYPYTCYFFVSLSSNVFHCIKFSWSLSTPVPN